jgi:hypothetical protein
MKTLTQENSKTMTESQVRDQNAVHPSRNCDKNVSTVSLDDYSIVVMYKLSTLTA